MEEHGFNQYDEISKRQLYAHYDIAIKFGLQNCCNDDGYVTLWESLRQSHRWNCDELHKEIERINGRYNVKSGCVLELPVQDDTGQDIGVKFLVLHFETGPELWLSIEALLTALSIGPEVLQQAHAAMTDLATDIGKDLAKDALLSGAGAVASAALMWIARKWPDSGLGWRAPIRYVEVRTKEKGVKRFHFSDFAPSMLTCLVMKFHDIKTLDDVRDTCFAGKSFDPP